VIIAVIAVCGYFGYRKFAGGTAGNVVFTSNDCGDPCQSAVAHLTMAGVEFTECNIDSSKENLKKFRKYGGNTLPLAIISDKPLFGYNQATYQNVIDEFQGKYLQESANSVVMYSSRGCGYCRRAQELFAEYRIQYVEHDISYPDSRQRYTELNGRGVPLILINGTRINGFDKQAILEALQKAGLM
jgi:glutaredoxin